MILISQVVVLHPVRIHHDRMKRYKMPLRSMEFLKDSKNNDGMSFEMYNLVKEEDKKVIRDARNKVYIKVHEKLDTKKLGRIYAELFK